MSHTHERLDAQMWNEKAQGGGAVEVQWRCCGGSGGDEITGRDDDGSGEVQRKRAGGCVKKRCR